MQSSNQPGKISVPFAESGQKQPIPVASQVGIEDGRASYTTGFPELTRTPLAAGGVPPFGTDMNGILFALSAIQQWQSAGGGFVFDSTFAAAIGGYPKGSILVRSDGSGLWKSTTESNVNDPDAGGAGWQPVDSGITSIAVASSNVTLTPQQAANPIILITGVMTANINVIFPTYPAKWTIINRATGAFSVTVKTAAGAGIAIRNGATTDVSGDGVNIVSPSPQVKTAVYNTVGTFSWTRPPGVSSVRVKVIGGGGGGGRNVSGTPPSGGGGGGVAEGVINLESETTISVTVGAGGAGGATAGANGAAGSQSVFGVYVSAAGGAGGPADGVAAGFGGVGSGAPLNYSIGSGSPPIGTGGGFGGGGESPAGAFGTNVPVGPGQGGAGRVNNAGVAGAKGIVIIEYI